MSLSKQTIAMLLDLVEIKISYMDIADREDARDLQVLQRCRAELRALEPAAEAEPAEIVPFAAPVRRPGRPRATL